MTDASKQSDKFSGIAANMYNILTITAEDLIDYLKLMPEHTGRNIYLSNKRISPLAYEFPQERNEMRGFMRKKFESDLDTHKLASIMNCPQQYTTNLIFTEACFLH